MVKEKRRLQIKGRLILRLRLSDVASCYTQDYFASDGIEIRAPQPCHRLRAGCEGERLLGLCRLEGTGLQEVNESVGWDGTWGVCGGVNKRQEGET